MPPRRQPQRRRPAKQAAPRGARATKPRPAKTDGDQPTAQTGDRLQKVLALAGVASRRECEELIREGRVEVDRKVVTELGTRVDPLQHEIRVDGETLLRPTLTYFAVNKPTGVVATARDPSGRMRVTDLLPPNTPRVFCVGRLDMASEGLIIVTNDGELANGLTHPRHGIEKVYHVQVAGQVAQEVLAQLHKGIHLAEGFAHVKHVRIKTRGKQSTILEMVLDEGRNREVRRLLARVGHKVQKLKRIAVGPVRLGDLPAGAVRPLMKKEVESLQAAIARGPVDKPPREESTKPRDKSHRDESAKPLRTPKANPKKPQPRGNEPKSERTVIG
jgi:23S rRNA pseudouridine2605 synthase